ncbi:MAG TPA: hypothetical protein VG838_15835 [Opitutaceae bacterium]|nr:hypothetical protein [Opitutaceae bacterium]
MITILLLFRWLCGRLIVGALIAGLGVIALALWLFMHDAGDFEATHTRRLTSLAGQKTDLQYKMADLARRRDATANEIAAEQARAAQADKVIAQLHDLESTWDRLVGNPAQQKANAEQIAHMEEVRASAQTKEAALREDAKRQVWERDGMELAQQKIEDDITFAKNHDTPIWHYLGQAWDRSGTVVEVGLVLYFFLLLLFAPKPKEG